MPHNLADVTGFDGFREKGIALRTPGQPLPYEWAGDVRPVLDGLWVIYGWLPKCGIVVIYGHPGSGKTFFALDMATAVATGHDWAGRAVEQGAVIYVVAEGQTGFRNRLAAIIDSGRMERTAPFVFIPSPIDLQAPDGDTAKLIATIEEVRSKISVRVGLIVIDTLSKTFGAGKENGDDMAAYVANCQRVASAFDCCTAILHHRPKDSESRDLRGHSSLRGGIDTAILVEGGEIKTATSAKQREGEDNETVRFELERIVLGADSRGHEVSTCLVHISENEAPASKQILDPLTRAKRGLKGHAKTVFRVIEETAAKFGVDPPHDIPSEKIDRWKTTRAVKGGQVADNIKMELESIIGGEADKRADTISRTIRREMAALKSKEILGSWGDWLWVN